MKKITKRIILLISLLVLLFCELTLLTYRNKENSLQAITEHGKVNYENVFTGKETLSQISNLNGEIKANTNNQMSAQSLQNYLDRLVLLTNNLIDKKSTISYDIATRIIDSSLETLDCLYKNGKWNALEKSSQTTAAISVYTLIDTLSALMNIQLEQQAKANYSSYERSMNNFHLQSRHLKKTNVIKIYTTGFFTVLNLPLSAVHNYAGGDEELAITATSIDPKINIYKGNAEDKAQLIQNQLVNVKVGNMKVDVSLNAPYKLELKTDTLGILYPSCASWHFIHSEWSSIGCSLFYEDMFTFGCECDHLGVLAVFSSLPHLPSTPKITSQVDPEITKIANNITELFNANSETVESFTAALDQLKALTFSLIGKESLTTLSIARNITTTSLSILEKLYTQFNIWSQDDKTTSHALLDLFTIIKALSTLMNTQTALHSVDYYEKVSTSYVTLLSYPVADTKADLINKFYIDSDYTVVRVNLSALKPMNLAQTATVFRDIGSCLSNKVTVVYRDIFTVNVANQNAQGTVQIEIPYFHYMFKPRCVYWNFDLIDWDGTGCSFDLEKPPEMSICKCSYKSNFGIFTIIGDVYDTRPTEHAPPTTATFNSTSSHSVNPTTSTTTTSPSPTKPTPVDTNKALKNMDTMAASLNNKTTPEEWSHHLDNLAASISQFTEDNFINSVNYSIAHSITRKSLHCLNQLIEALPNVSANLTSNSFEKTSSLIFTSITNLSVLLNAKQDESNNVTTIEFNSISLQTKHFENTSEQINFQFSNSAHFDIPLAALNNTNSSSFAVSATILKSIPAANLPSTEMKNSDFLDITVGRNRTSLRLVAGEKLKLTMHHQIPLFFRDRPICAFWNTTNLTWSTFNCTLNRRQSNRTSTVCECDHLTNFAVLVDFKHREENDSLKQTLTWIFSTTNVISLFSTLAIAFAQRKRFIRKQPITKAFDSDNASRFFILVSLSAWLLIVQLLVLFGLDQINSENACSIISISLLFALLCAFAFMLMLSAHVYFYNFNAKQYHLVVYQGAIVYIVFSIAWIWYAEFQFEFNQKNFQSVVDSLKSEYFCWISTEKYPNHILIFLIPMTTIVFIDSLLLVAICRKHLKNSEKEWFKWCALHFFNVGLVWLSYGFFVFDVVIAIPFSYIFIGLSGTQGVSFLIGQLDFWLKSQCSAEEMSEGDDDETSEETIPNMALTRRR